MNLTSLQQKVVNKVKDRLATREWFKDVHVNNNFPSDTEIITEGFDNTVCSIMVEAAILDDPYFDVGCAK